LASKVAEIEFPTPVGLAAGFDKDAKAPGRMLWLGFGFVEVGTVTPEPQPGNPSPRAFRLVEDEAMINRYGFNSDGHQAVARRLARRRDKRGIVGVNLGANRTSTDKVRDYILGVERFAGLADYLTINISSPNTPGLRELQAKEQLARLASALVEARKRTNGPPLFLKVSPDLVGRDIIDVARVAVDEGVSGLIVGNTTVSRPETLASTEAHEKGGLSGAPLKPLALTVLRAFRSELGSKLPLVGVGGISSAEDAYERIRAGASLVQLCTALPYKGPSVASDINEGLLRLLTRDGFANVADAVGADDPKPQQKSKKQKARQELQPA
jgi:dihydroorotate dehydrogenase